MAKSEWVSDPVQTGRNIKKQRRKLGMTQAQLAEEMGGGMTDKTVSKYERGVHEMGIQLLYDFAEALHTTPDTLAPDRFQEDKPDVRLEEIEDLFAGLDESTKDTAYAMMKNTLLTLQLPLETGTQGKLRGGAPCGVTGISTVRWSGWRGKRNSATGRRSCLTSGWK